MTKTLSQKTTKKNAFNPDYGVIKKAALTLRAIDHKERQKIMELLDQKRELPVTDIYVKMRMEQSKASAYLAMLRKANLVIVRKDGQQRFYSVNYERLKVLENSCKLISE